MFTGIIEEIGTVTSVTRDKLTIQSSYVINGTKQGDSIAINGVCLTVTKIERDRFEADVSPETMKVTNLSNLKSGSPVNLECALPANGRFGGHIVTGHVDCQGKIVSLNKDNRFYTMGVELPSDYTRYTVKKGSIAVNGISLTIADIKNNILNIAVIPHTFQNTNLKVLHTGDYVNIETDILSKYVEKFLSTSDNKTGISMEFLMENGF